MADTTIWFNRRLYHIDSRMTDKQARRILERGAPDLSYEMRGQHPWLWKPGDRIVFSPELEVEILKVHGYRGRWRVNYLVKDHRPKLLGKQTGYTDNPTRAISITQNDEQHGFQYEAEAVDPPVKSRDQETAEFRCRAEKRKAQPVKRRPGRWERMNRRAA